MKDKKIIQEVFLLRALACLSIVMLHSITRVYGEQDPLIKMITVLLTFGTPAFIFISELVISKSYPDSTPKRFWTQRVKYILMPYVCFGIFYAFSKAMEGWIFDQQPFLASFANLTWRHLLIGDYQGYFILIIFQFYVLHMLFQKYMTRFSAKWVITGSLLLNLAYLSFFNFTAVPEHPILKYIWLQGFWLPFFGWLFYFTVAFYCGRYYMTFMRGLKKRQWWVYTGTVISAIIPPILINTGVLTSVSSKRIDMLLFTILMTFSLYLIANRLKRIPHILVKVSQYSFGIYLLHPFYLGLMIIGTRQIPLLTNSILGIAVLFFGSTLLSIWTAMVLHRIPYGAYLIGKLGIHNRSEQEKASMKLSKPTARIS